MNPVDGPDRFPVLRPADQTPPATAPVASPLQASFGRAVQIFGAPSAEVSRVLFAFAAGPEFLAAANGGLVLQANALTANAQAASADLPDPLSQMQGLAKQSGAADMERRISDSLLAIYWLPNLIG